MGNKNLCLGIVDNGVDRCWVKLKKFRREVKTVSVYKVGSVILIAVGVGTLIWYFWNKKKNKNSGNDFNRLDPR